VGSLSTRALTHGNTLGPYSIAVFLTVALCSPAYLECVFHEEPLVGSPVASADFSRPHQRPFAWLTGGAIWTTGTVFNLVAANFTGVAISYAIGQSAPMVAALWASSCGKIRRSNNGDGLPRLMFIFYILAILLIARANTRASRGTLTS